jgi:hypothetical protein
MLASTSPKHPPSFATVSPAAAEKKGVPKFSTLTIRFPEGVKPENRRNSNMVHAGVKLPDGVRCPNNEID